MSKVRRIGILTGGGDVPGLNSVIKSVVYKSTELGYQVLGIRRGWEGLTHMKPGAAPDADYIRPLDRINTRGIDRSGGTMLHTSRTNPIRIKNGNAPAHLAPDQLERLRVNEKYFDFTPVVLDNIARLGLDYLIPIGGDDTLSYAQILAGKGVPLIAVPKTMDNDVRGTEYCIGFSTAITRAKDLITRQRSTLGSHERIGVFRIFGRDSGFTALYSAYVTSARCVLPEVEFDIDRLVALLVEDKRNNPSRYSFVIASEGAVWLGQKVAEFGEADAYGHKKKVDIGHALAEEIKKRAGEDTMSSDLTYDLRSGEADALDQMVAITFANIAMDLVRDGACGRMTAVQDGKYTHAPLPDPKAGPRKVDVARLYNLERFRPHYSEKLGAPMLLSAEHS
ncbi:MAG: 6-phosphofructokinase [Acidobacteria bacterium]|nr:6-phosphofructokinase [Acidobacteriota bacterium]MBI3662170.1 6-phosphofructokinase [Acidobacteriota bacterium]